MIDESTRRDLHLYVDGELDGAAKEVLRQRIDSSPELQAELQELQKTTTAMGRYFSREAEKARPESAAESVAVERIVRETTTLLARRPARRPTFLVVLLVLIGVALAGLGLRQFLSSEPEPLDLARGAKRQLSGNYYEVILEEVSMFRRFEALIGALNDVSDAKAETSMHVGPGGLVHFQLRAQGAGLPLESHIGFDGDRYWTWSTGMDEVKSLRTLDDGLREDMLPVLLWRELLGALEGRDDEGSDLELPGRERVAGEDRELWRLDVRGDHARERATLWFDDAGEVRRVSFSGIRARLVPRSALSPADFEIGNWAPGLPIREYVR